MSGLSWSAAWRIARRDLHRRFRGLRLLLVCLFLGVGALAAIGSLTSAIRGELDAQGRTILGGDLEVEVWQRPLNATESKFLSSYGTLSPGLRMQAMASTATAATPVELKAVSDNWPLFGELVLEGGNRMGAPPEGQAWLAPGAAERLGVGPGDRIRIGTASVIVGGIIADEPDRLSEGFALGQTVIVPLDLPETAGLTAPGAMYQSKTRVRFDGNPDPASVEAALGKIHERYARAIRLRVIEERAREEVAKELGVTPATFDVLLHRATAALKKALEKEEPNDSVR